MRTVKGDIVKLAEEGEFDVIVHGCNCFHSMGAGVAKQIAYRWPNALKSDKSTIYGCTSKLGSFSVATCYDCNDISFFVVNAYTQFLYGSSGRKVNYESIAKCFEGIRDAYHPATRIAYPQIGCGLAGGNWNIVKTIIDETLKGRDHVYVEYDG